MCQVSLVVKYILYLIVVMCFKCPFDMPFITPFTMAMQQCSQRKTPFNCADIKPHARKLVFGGLRTTKAQTSLCICTVLSAHFIDVLKSTISKLATSEISLV